MRKKMLSIIAGVLCALFVTTAWASKETSPIKIGLLCPLSGVFALIGQSMKSGFILAFEQTGNIGGRKVEIIVEDTEAKVDIAVAKAKKLVSADKVHLLAGGVASSEGLAIRDFAEANQIPYICTTGTAAIEFISTKRSKWMKHPWIAANLFGGHLPYYMVKELGAKRVITMAPDYAWGHSEVQWAKASAEQGGGTVVQTILTPFPTLDFSPYLTQLKSADVLIANYAGADAPRLVKQFREYGIKMLFAGGGTFTPETVEVMGRDPIGCYAAAPWFPVLENPENVAYMKAYRARYGKESGLYAAGTYSSALVLIDVLRNVNGDVEEKERFLNAWYGLERKTVKTPCGEIGYEKVTEAGIWEVHICKIVEKGGKITYEILKTDKGLKGSDQLKIMGLLK